VSGRNRIGALCAILLVESLISGCSAEVEPLRTVAAVDQPLPNDRGTVYARPANDEASLLGIALNDPHTRLFPRMSESSVKVSHGVVSVIRPNGESQWPWFPYQEFNRYEQREVAAGRAPLRLTATYEGKSRPVYWNWSLGFPAPGQPPSVTDEGNWDRAVNVGDERYVQWLVDNYVKPIMLHQYFTADGQAIDVDAPYPNEWLGIDQMAINYRLFGVLDDEGRWVPMDRGPVMDQPFRDGSAAMHDAYRHFFKQLHQALPGLRVMINMGTPDDWAAVPLDFADVDGLINEEVFWGKQPNGTVDDRAKLVATWTAISAFSNSGRLTVLGSLLTPSSSTYETALRSGLMAYLLLSGPNSAWAPKTPEAAEIPPSAYQAMKSALGRATSALSTQPDESSGGALFSRQTEHGTVYVNYTGHDVTVQCPSGLTCRDRAGTVVAELSIADLTGDYLLTSG
jgi:hypothetical protein